jgi:hypothetical protein
MSKKERIEKLLPVLFTENELTSFKNALAFHSIDLMDLEDEKKADTKVINDRIKDCKDSIRDLSKKLKDGQEMRSVECRLEYDHTREVVFIFRADTDEKIEERPMTEEERQVELFQEK